MKTAFKPALLSSLLALASPAPAATAAAKPPVGVPASATNSPPASPRVTPSDSLRSRGLLPVASWTASQADAAYLSSVFAIAHQAAMSIPPSSQHGFLDRSVEDTLSAELSIWVSTNGDSAWAPGVHLLLGRRAELRSNYLTAMNHFRTVWQLLAGVAQIDPAAKSMAREATSRLAKLLALTGQLAELSALETAAVPLVGADADWSWAREMRRWATVHPEESYKCGLYGLDQLARLTAATGTYSPPSVLENESSTNGWSAADLVALAAKVALDVRAYTAVDLTNLPIPSVVHLASQHFVVVRRREGQLYEVYDPVAFGPKMLTPAELAAEATGCILTTQAAAAGAGSLLVPLSAVEAASYRGRCHGPLAYDHLNSPCSPTTCPPCPPGGSGVGTGKNGQASAGSQGSSACSSCQQNAMALQHEEALRSEMPSAGPAASAVGGGMATWFVSEPYLNLWVQDTPLSYRPPLGPPVNVTVSHTDRVQPSVVSGAYTQGAVFGDAAGIEGFWACSLLSYAELDSVQDTVDIAMPGGGWTTFVFTNGSGSYNSTSFIAYGNNSSVQQVGTTSTGTPPSSLVLNLPDGSQYTYGVCNTANVGGSPSYRVYFVSSMADPAGNTTTFAYDGNYNLTNVTAADGTTFALAYTNSIRTNVVTSVTASYGASASFGYVLTTYAHAVLTNITDAAGIESFVGHDGNDIFNYLITPYGTTSFNNDNTTSGSMFDRFQQITRPDGSVEFYAQINQATNTDWPAFTNSVIPTNTPIGTLDTGTNRLERNTFYWNAAQWAPFTNQSVLTLSLSWSNLMTARIRHYLASTDPTYSHWVALASEQDPSPDGGTTEGQITWYDYVGKPSGATNEVGTQVQPSVIARVMPDGSTWYDYYVRNTNGLPTQEIEQWVVGGTALFRTNTWTYSTNGIDMIEQTGPLGETVSSNWFNSNHQVVTNYDAEGQMTTYTYNANMQLLTTSLPTGLNITNTYNGSSRLENTVDSLLRTNSYTWNSDGTVATFTDERNMTVTKFWDGLHRPTGSAYPDGTTTTNLYILGGTNILDLTAHEDRLGHWTYFVYDSLRRKTAETNANNVETTYGYCECGALTSVTGAANSLDETTTYTYDDEPRLTQVEYPDGSMVTNALDLLGRIVIVSDSMGSRTNTFDNLGRLVAVSNAFGQVQASSLDIEDNLTNQTDANGVSIASTFDSLHRLTSRTYPDGGVEGFVYNAARLITYTNQLTNTTWYTLDDAGRKTAETNANSGVTKFTFDPAGDLLTLSDPKTNVTTWHYDLYGRVTNKVDATSTTILGYSYDADDRLTNRWRPITLNTGYRYDAVGNLTNIVYSDLTVKFKYDALNRRTNMVDAVGTTAWTWLAGGLLGGETGPFTSDAITYAYTNRLRSSLVLTQPTGAWTNKYGYDAAGRISTITSPSGTFTYDYKGAGLLYTNLALPNTSYISNTFDNVARLTATYLTTSSGAVTNSHGYTYDKASQRTQQTRTDGSAVTYTYDPIGQLKTAHGSGGQSTESLGYLYDGGWNLSKLTNGVTTTSYTYNSLNENTGYGTYDENGGLTNGNMASLMYDHEGQLTNFNQFQIAESTFLYDGLGRLRTRVEYAWVTGMDFYAQQGTTNYIYDGNLVIELRSGSSPTETFTRGPDFSGTLEGAGGVGGLLARSYGYSGGNWSTHDYYQADGNGNITFLEATNQSEAAAYHYDPFGNTFAAGGTLASANLFRFSSKEIHATSGFYYYGYRFYDPTIQRWLNRDPIGELGGINLYTYCDNDPEDEDDPYGLDGTNNPPSSLGKFFKYMKDCGSAGKQFCKDQMKKMVGRRGPLPPNPIAGVTTAVGGALVNAGTAVLQAGPGMTVIAAVAGACDTCKKCMSNPSYGCGNTQADRACDKACADCEQMKNRSQNVQGKL